MGSASISSCSCCMFVSCVHHVAVLIAAFRMACGLLILIEDTRSDHMEESYSMRSQNHECLLHVTLSSVFIICRGVCVLICCKCVCCV